MIGKITILFGHSGNQTKFLQVSSHGKNIKIKYKRMKTKSVAPNRRGQTIANYQLKLLIRKAPPRKRI